MSLEVLQVDNKFTVTGDSTATMDLVMTYIGDVVVCRIPTFTMTKLSGTNTVALTSGTSLVQSIEPYATVSYIIPINEGAGYCSVSINPANDTITLDFTATGAFTSATIPQVYLPWTAFISMG